MKRLTVAALLVCGSAGVQAQSPETLEWGPPVAGVQLRLALAPQLATPQVPVFEVQLRNQSGNALTYVAEAPGPNRNRRRLVWPCVRWKLLYRATNRQPRIAEQCAAVPPSKQNHV
jgi:hypothetical protein